MNEKDQPKKKIRKPGEWGPMDIIIGLLALAALAALTIGAFKVAQWVVRTYF